MSEDPENMVLSHLRVIRSEIVGVRDTLAEHGLRLTRIEFGIARLRRDQGQDAEHVAHIEARLDRFQERLGRVERRSDLTETTTD